MKFVMLAIFLNSLLFSYEGCDALDRKGRILLKGAVSLYDYRSKFEEEKVKIVSKKNVSSKEVAFLNKAKWKIMHDIGNVRKKIFELSRYDFIISDGSKKFRCYKYVDKDLFLDPKKLTKKEFIIKKDLQKDLDSLIDFVNIMKYEMYAVKKDGIYYLNMKKSHVKKGFWPSLDSDNYLDYFYEWKIPSYFFSVKINENRQLVYVSYNNEANVLEISKSGGLF